MASRSCVSGCGRFLTSSDGHDRCPSCLGFRHAEATLVDESCSHCGNMTMAMLRSRYLLARRGGIPLALPRSSSSGWRTTSAQGQGDLRITVRASPSSTSPRASHSSSTSHRLGFPDEYAGSSDRAGPSISFGAPADDGISITASGDELGSGEDDSASLPAQKQMEAFQSHPAPAVCCCLHPTAGCSPSVCSSPRAPSCCLHLRSSSATTAACTTAAAWSWPQETGAARPRPCQACEAPGQAASLRRATRSLWILLFRRWWPHHSFPWRRAGWRIFCFLFVLFRHWPPGGTQNINKRAVSFSSGSIPVQGPSLRAIPVASCLHQGRRSSPCTVKRSRHSYPQLPRRLAHSGPVSSTVVRTQGYGVQSPQPVGTSGQPGKEQTLPYAEDLFSRHGVGLGQPHSTSLRGACSVNAEMPGRNVPSP